MVRLSVSGEATDLQSLVDHGTWVDALRLVGARAVTVAPSSDGVVFGVVVDGRRTVNAAVQLRGAAGQVTGLISSCGCRERQPCVHATAVAAKMLDLDVEVLGHLPGPRAETAPSRWRSQLDRLAARGEREEVAARGEPLLALQFELVVPGAAGSRGSRSGSGAGSLALRPAKRGKSGKWIRTGVSWSTLRYHGYADGRSARDERHVELLQELLLIVAQDLNGYYGYGSPNALNLEQVTSRRVWDILAEAQDAGLPMVRSGAGEPPVVFVPEPASCEVAAGRGGRHGRDLQLAAEIRVGERRPRPDAVLLVGDPGHGLAWWAEDGVHELPHARGCGPLFLARFDGSVDRDLAGLLTDPIRVPDSEEQQFFRDYYPGLHRRYRIVAVDPSVELPEVEPTRLALAVRTSAGAGLDLAWAWESGAIGARATETLYGGVQTGGDVEVRHRTDLLKTARDLVDAVPAVRESLLDRGPLGRLEPAVTVSGMAMVTFVEQVLPALQALDGLSVTIDLDGPLPAFRPAEGPARVTFASDSADEGSGSGLTQANDWFDLAVTVSVDGEEVPFVPLFTALAQGEEYYVAPSGTYLRLDAPELARLGELIAESRALADAPPSTLRVGRHQAGVWQDVEELGELSGPAAGWASRLRSLVDRWSLERPAHPLGLKAELRPYQEEGFAWLAGLYRLGLGGILADDMGLGKTLQALALICHVIEEHAASSDPTSGSDPTSDPTSGPTSEVTSDEGGRPRFLVVAPTSVVHTWAAEAARFAPDLRVATVTETLARRGVELAGMAEEADVVVTSYTLLRLEHAAYQQIAWRGMFLDEAQSVKNRATSTWSHVAGVPAQFRVAVTGTPLENNLMELWALLALTAPGLFPSARRFTEHYRTPIERERDAERLAQLRRRIHPVLLRRTKDEVAPDLPDKQEQVLELDLHAKHRASYDRYLQRERQKVLGLLDDMDRNRIAIFSSLTVLRQASLAASLVDGSSTAAGIPSAKLDTLAEMVGDLAREGHRALVFSQFTRFLTLARERLEADGVECVYLDGRTRNRGAVVERFRTGTAPAFLISLKAGGTGLTLTEADYCIVLDPWWNPATEAQAVDRAHRIGQTRKVNVYRLVSRGTIEEKVMALKERKAALFDDVLGDGEFASTALTADDIRGLLT